MREVSLSSKPGRMMTLACSVCSQTGNIVSAVVDSKKNRAYLAVCQYKVSIQKLSEEPMASGFHLRIVFAKGFEIFS